MKKINPKVLFIIPLFAFVLASCSSNTDTTEETTTPESSITNFKKTVKYSSSSELIYSQEYTLDSDEKVTLQVYTNYTSPQYSFTREFMYNNDGKLIGYNGSEFIQWENNIARIYNENEELIAECEFAEDRLIRKTQYANGAEIINYINYDENNNIVSIENTNGIIAEYLDYDLAKENPLNLTKSTAFLDISLWREYSTNIFLTEKNPPINGDDFIVPEAFYSYSYEFDSNNRVIATEDEKSLIYTTEFEYEE